MDIEPYVRNSFGALNGGVLAGLAETAAVGPGGGVARQLTVHYLRQATVGPVVARAALARRDRRPRPPRRVEVVDAGADDRCCAVATVLVEPPA